MRTDEPPLDARRSKWLLCAGVAFCALLMTAWPHGLAEFRYDRAGLGAGQFWRVLSAHLVHVNGPHLLLNVVGLFLIGELLWADLPLVHGAGLMLSSALGVAGLLWWLQPQLLWYAGLSGVLHGLWAGCALAGCWLRPPALHSATRIVGGAGLALLLVKMTVEWHSGPPVQTSQIIGAPVVTLAHLYGALVGAVYFLIWRIVESWRHRS